MTTPTPTHAATVVAGHTPGSTRENRFANPTPTPALYVDLDGTIRDNEAKFVNGPEDVQVMPDAVEALTAWRSATNGRVAGITNQGGVALGHVGIDAVLDALVETNRQTGWLLDTIVYCPHHPDADNPAMRGCWCRKPRTGIIATAAAELHRLYPHETYPPYLGVLIGDLASDQQCAEYAGLQFVWAEDWRAG